MTLVSMPGGILYPASGGIPGQATTSTFVVDVTDEKFAMIGRCYIEGRASSKTLSAANGSITFHLNSATFANANTTLEVGIQDVSTASQPGPPDGTFDVSAVFTGHPSTPPLATGWNTLTLSDGTAGSGGNTKTISHGQLIAVVFDLTNVGGSDAITFRTDLGAGLVFPYTNFFSAAAWASGNERRPAGIFLEFDDGTLGTIDGSIIGGFADGGPWDSEDTPDERGIIFQVPWDCTIDGLWASISFQDSAAPFELSLYSDPTGTPTSIANTQSSISLAAGTNGLHVFPVTPVNLTRGTNYGVTIKPTDTILRVTTSKTSIPDTSYLVLHPGGSTFSGYTMNNGTGTANTTDEMYPCGVRISALHDTSSGGSSGFGVIGG